MRKMKLGAILGPTGSHAASWRHPSSARDGSVNIRRYVEGAQTAERAKLDFVFLTDGLAMQNISMEALSRTASFGARLEPLTALSAVAMCTSHIGLVATASTTYNEPFHLARKFASLDHISDGRAGWNLVTSSTEVEALNFSRSEHMLHADRYKRANEFADVVRALWDSWDDDAFIRDPESGLYFEPGKLHVPHHKGEYFQVKGPLTVARSPQGHPIIFQAGSSGPGMALAARTADCIFTAQPALENGQAFYRQVKALAASFGRNPDDLKIMPGFNPVVAATRAEAQAKFRELEELVHPLMGLGMLSMALGIELDPAIHPLDGPIPELPPTNSGQSRQAMLLDTARRDNLTLRELALRQVNGSGNSWAVGTPSDIADKMEEMFTQGAADGFALTPAVLPSSLDDIAEFVVPELQKRGLFRTEYEGATLRENLGIPRPDLVGRQRETADS